MLNSVSSAQIFQRANEINNIRPVHIGGSNDYELHSSVANHVENVGIVNNLMLEKVLENQEKIMKKLDIEA